MLAPRRIAAYLNQSALFRFGRREQPSFKVQGTDATRHLGLATGCIPARVSSRRDRWCDRVGLAPKPFCT
jgi:hypothetical protein